MWVIDSTEGGIRTKHLVRLKGQQRSNIRGYGVGVHTGCWAQCSKATAGITLILIDTLGGKGAAQGSMVCSRTPGRTQELIHHYFSYIEMLQTQEMYVIEFAK